MQIDQFNRFYFLGIGGIGMSALARYFNSLGKKVYGFDKTSTSLTDELIREGMHIHFNDDVSIAGAITAEGKGDLLVVYTPAIPASHQELNFFRKEQCIIKKRAEVLGMITENSFTVAVGGTHGKTTTSSMIAHLLNNAGMHCTAFLGGIAKNFNSNLLLPSHGKGKAVTVVEADEYDRSFLQLSPDIAVITSMDADHLDIYGTHEELKSAFLAFAERTKKNGRKIVKYQLPVPNAVTYSLADATADYSVKHLKVVNHTFQFDIETTSPVMGVQSGMPGIHNVENALAATAVAQQLGLSEEQIKQGISSFQGVKRRFDIRYKSTDVTYIDDYAHHPDELKACIKSVKELYPGEHLLGIFQPHLFSRTRDFADGFAESLSLLDELILMEIYPARELPIPGITSELILNKCSANHKSIADTKEIYAKIEKFQKGVILTLGAGDIDLLVDPIQHILNSRK